MLVGLNLIIVAHSAIADPDTKVESPWRPVCRPDAAVRSATCQYINEFSNKLYNLKSDDPNFLEELDALYNEYRNNVSKITHSPDYDAPESSGSERLEAQFAARYFEIEKSKQKASSADSSLPLCASKDVIASVQSAVKKSPEGLTEGVSMLGIKDVKESAFIADKEVRVCEGTGFFNNGKRNVVFTIEWFNDEKTKYYVQTR
jgi:hypothetical protein